MRRVGRTYPGDGERPSLPTLSHEGPADDSVRPAKAPGTAKSMPGRRGKTCKAPAEPRAQRAEGGVGPTRKRAADKKVTCTAWAAPHSAEHANP